MIARLLGAILRAMIVILLIALPGLLIPGATSDSAQFAALLSIFLGILILVEYTSETPIMIEFRDAPPYNRIRVLSLIVMVFLVTALIRGAYVPTPLANVSFALGDFIGRVLDFPYSPIRLTVLMLPDTATAGTVELVRAAAGLAFAISLTTLAVFIVIIRTFGWPERHGTFNVLTNLPMFDPTSGGDVVERLAKGARINIIFGFLLPFIIPACIKSSGQFFDPFNFENPQTLVWLIVLWAFLPASLYMRGIAMGRLVYLIESKRRQRYEEAESERAYA